MLPISNSSRLRVLQVVEPGTDGVFRHVEGLCHFLLAAGHEVHLAYSSLRGSDRLLSLVRKVESAGGRCCDLRTGNSPGLSDFRALWRLQRLRRQSQPMIVHGHSSKAGGLARLLPLLGLRVPVIYTPNAYYGMGRTGGMKATIFNALERYLGRIGWTINVSEDEAEWAREVLKLSRTHSRVIPNTVDTNHFIPGNLETRARLRMEMGWPDDAIVLGTVGRLSPQKDPLTLYRAVGTLMATEPRLHLLHVGRGELAPELDLLVKEFGIADRVKRLEYLADTVGFYQGVDAFISTSIYEGLPIAVLEALSAGLPLLFNDAPGNRGFLKLGLSHLSLTQPRQVDLWIRLIHEWLRQPIISGHSAKGFTNHRAIAERCFSLPAGYGKVVDFYGELLAESGLNPTSKPES